MGDKFSTIMQKYFHIFLLHLSVLLFANGDLQFDAEGNLLDDGLSEVLAHPSNLTTHTASPTEKTPAVTSPSNANRNDDNISGLENVLMAVPQSDKVRGGALIKMVPGDKRLTLRNIKNNLSQGKPGVGQTTTPTNPAEEVDQYQYVAYPQGDGEEEGLESKSNAVLQKKKPKVSKSMFPKIEPASADNSDQNNPTQLPPLETTRATKLPSEAKFSINSLIPCKDTNPKACIHFKPFCNIQIKEAFLKCQKTCGFCQGKKLIYEARFSVGIKGLIQFQQFFPGYPVYMTGCFEKSSVQKIEDEVGFIIHERRIAPTGDDPICPYAGPHWNPFGSLHGKPSLLENHHLGDLGNVAFNATSTSPPKAWPENGAICSEEQASAYSIYNHLDLFSNPPDGHLLVIHKKKDDYGRNFFQEKSRTTGNVGGALTCGLLYFKKDGAPVEEETAEGTKEEEREEEHKEDEVSLTGESTNGVEPKTQEEEENNKKMPEIATETHEETKNEETVNPLMPKKSREKITLGLEAKAVKSDTTTSSTVSESNETTTTKNPESSPSTATEQTNEEVSTISLVASPVRQAMKEPSEESPTKKVEEQEEMLRKDVGKFENGELNNIKGFKMKEESKGQVLGIPKKVQLSSLPFSENFKSTKKGIKRKRKTKGTKKIRQIPVQIQQAQ